MLKIVIFDSGYGGEFFADRLSAELPIVEIIRVINWRKADVFLNNPREARKIARESLLPYIGKVDLVIFANYLLTITSLKYFQRNFKNQLFIGLNLTPPDTFVKKDVLVLSTTAVSKTLRFHTFIHGIKRNIHTINLNSWPEKIDDGELNFDETLETLARFIKKIPGYHPKEIILASSQFEDIKNDLKTIFGPSTRIYDGFDEAIRQTCIKLRIRGSAKKKAK